MATQTLEFNATQGLTLTAKLFALGSDTVVQSVSATAKSNDKGRYAAVFTDVPAGRYRLNAFVGANGGFANELYKITLNNATFFPESESQQAVYAPVERPTDDTAVIEFYWPIASATFTNSASTCKRRFLGETGAQEEALSGAISAISGKAGWYKLAYALADRAADATTVIPTSVTYTLVDDNGNTGELTLVIVEFADDSAAAILQLLTSGNVQATSPVTPTGTILSIVIGDDYKASSARSFDWLVAVPTFSISSAECYFGGSAKHKGSWLVEGTITAVTVDSVPRWKLQFELDDTDTADCKPGCYDWSVELRGPAPEQITKVLGTTELIEAYTR